MSKYKSTNPERIYKRTNNAIINSQRIDDIDPKKLKGCLNKVGYDTEFEAEIWAAKKSMRSYKCLYCPHYHLTSQRPKTSK